MENSTKSANKRGFHSLIVEISGALTFLILALAAVAVGIFLLPPKGELKGTVTNQVKPTDFDEGAEVFALSGERLADRTGGILRLHIIANSDSSRDQSIKLAVRDAVLAFEKNFSGQYSFDTAEETERFVLERGKELLSTVNAVLKERGAGYGAQLMLGDFDFPQREYDGEIYPAGEYRALRILLGDACGKNWWCVLFPPLCLIKTGGERAPAQKDDGGIRFESLFVNLFNSIFGE